MPMVWSMMEGFPVGAGIEPPFDDGLRDSIAGVAGGLVGMMTSVGFRSRAGGATGLRAELPTSEGGGMREGPLVLRGAGLASGMLGGAKSLVLRCRGELGGGGRKGLESDAVEGSATMMAGT